jgi:hypothetical protein
VVEHCLGWREWCSLSIGCSSAGRRARRLSYLH